MKKINRNKRLFALLSFIIFCITNLQAQIDPMFSLYRFNNILVNPADAGQGNNPELFLQGRTQWVGINGNPTTLALTYSSKINDNSGVATSLLLDQVGPVKNYHLNFDYSYKLKLSKNLKLITALRLTAQNQTVNFGGLTFTDRDDASFTEDLNTGILGNGGFGLKLIYKNHVVGVAQPRILKYTYSGNENAIAQKNQNYLFVSYMGKFNLKENWEFNPQILTRTASDVPVSVDLTMAFNYQKTVDLGVLYRIESAVGFMLGYKSAQGIQFGYIYEYPTNLLNNFSIMTHEFSLKYGFNDLFKKDIVNPRNAK